MGKLMKEGNNRPNKPRISPKDKPKNASKSKLAMVSETKSQPKIDSYFLKPNKELFSSIKAKSSTSLLIPNLKKYTTQQNASLSRSKFAITNVTNLNNEETKFNNSTPNLNSKTRPGILDISSDIEIIECTPDFSRKRENKLDVSNFCDLSWNSLDDSLDFIPATPQCILKDKSKIGFKSITGCEFNISDVNLKSKKILNNINDLPSQHQSINGKRIAETGTGVSPNPKKSSNLIDDHQAFSGSVSKCMINLSEKIENSINSDLSNISEIESSFSLLQRGAFLESNGIKDFNSKSLLEKMDCEASESEVRKTNTITENLLITTHKLKDENKRDDKSSLDRVSNQPENLVCSSENIAFVKKTYLEGSDIRQETATAIEDEDDTFFDEMLSIDFDQFSPFKKSKPAKSENTARTSFSGVSKILFEDIGKYSYACREDYGRHLVETVERDIYRRDIKLQLRCSSSGLQQTCILKGYWYESVIKEGDVVHILRPSKVGDQLIVSNEEGIIVINPDFLLSGTSVVAGVFCQRKAILNERFKGYEPGNKIMLIGSVAHLLFQEAVKNKEVSDQQLNAMIKKYVYNPNVLRDLYAQNLSEVEIIEEIKKFKSPIVNWIKSYVNEPGKSIVHLPRINWNGKVESIEDIEENIWSPKYGIKGKIDATVSTISGNKKKVLPLELKTGNASFSAEHKGQVTLYSMMSSDRREDPQAGLLLYLKDGSMCEVPAGEKEKKGLIQLRNELVSFLTATPDTCSTVPILPQLPDPLDNNRVCSRCPHLLTCSALQKVTDSVPVAPHAMASLIPAAVAHLQESHLEYFRKWCLLLHLEIASSSNSMSIKALWCMDIAKREAAGTSLGDMILAYETEVFLDNSSHFFQKFVRDSSRNKKIPLIFQEGESVVVSSEREIAISMGVISSINENYVVVALDRDLKSYAKWKKKKFTIDHCEYRNTMSIFFTNLAHLMNDTPRSQKLRSLIIDRKQPEFTEGVEPEVVRKIKRILKNLNKNQQRAVLRSMLAKDYSILKGFPGTGKTSTIVGLIRILHCLGKSVLITSYTHSAVDNILLKLKEYTDVPILRLGKTSRIHHEIQEFAEEKLIKDKKSVDQIREFYDGQRIVATTCLGMGHMIFTHKSFDYCLIDEASQVLQAASLGPLFFSDRFILVGDALQLPPIVKNSTAKTLGMLESLMEYLDSKEASVCLMLQYRMNEPIMQIANHLIYDGLLQCATEELKTATLSLPLFEEASRNGVPKWLQKCTSPQLSDSVLFVDTLNHAPEVKDSNNQPTNPKEAKIILEIIKWLKNFGVSLNDIGVITPYRAQVKLLRDSSIHLCDSPNALEVNTVDQYQGRDKDVIIYSCVKSGLRQEDIKKGEILQDIRRLNVAITRAKVKLLVIGDMATLKFYDPFKKIFGIINDSQRFQIKQGENDFDWSLL